MNETTLKKYDYIDALRGIGILGVLLVHTTHLIPLQGIFATIAAEGARGVQLFYLVSALTTFLSMAYRSRHEEKSTLKFFIRRFFRIAPLFYLAIIFYTLYKSYVPVYWAPNGIKWWSILMTATFTHGLHPETINSVVPNDWTIAVEFAFYLMVPWLFVRLTNLKRSVWFLFISLIVGKILTFAALRLIAPLYPESQYYLVGSYTFLWIFSQLPVFVLGIVFYHLVEDRKNWRNKSLGVLLLAFAFLMFTAFLTTHTFGNLLPHQFLWGIAFFVFSLGLMLYPHWIFVNPVIKMLGKISFSIYLCHYGVLLFLKDMGLSKQLDQNLTGYGLGFIILLICSAGVAILTHFFIEKPGIKLGRYFIGKLS